MLTACCQHKCNQGRPSYLHNKDVIVRNLWLLFAKVPDVLIDMTMGRSKTGSKKHHMRVIGNSSSIVDLTAKPLSQPGPPNGPTPEGKAPGVSPLLHLRQRMQLMTMTIANDDASAPHQSHLPCVTGLNCRIKKEYTTFAVTVLGHRPGLQHGTRQTKCSLLNMLLDNVVTLTNLLAAVYLLDEPTDKHALARILACFSLLMLGADALTPAIIVRVWGQGNVVR